MQILGILNITADSFFDGGKFLEPKAALAHAEALMADGADILDIGAASSNPRGAAVAPEVEIARLAAVLPALKQKGATLSIDTFSTPVQRWALDQGVAYLNDIHGFADPALYPLLAASEARLIVMHAVQEAGVATAMDIPTSEIFGRVVTFFERRLEALTKAGIAADRLVLDPGMGFFLGKDPANSFTILARLAELKARFGLALLVSVSRKSFLRAGRPASEAGPASLAAELYAVRAGADFIRTHAPGPLRVGWKTLKHIEMAGEFADD
jgi:dihydropteroate synthase